MCFIAPTRLDDELFINKNVQPPGVIRFHPYEPHLAVADKTGVSIWNFEEGSKLNHFNNGNPKTTRITSLDILNEHDLSLLLTGSGMINFYFITLREKKISEIILYADREGERWVRDIDHSYSLEPPFHTTLF